MSTCQAFAYEKEKEASLSCTDVKKVLHTLMNSFTCPLKPIWILTMDLIKGGHTDQVWLESGWFRSQQRLKIKHAPWSVAACNIHSPKSHFLSFLCLSFLYFSSSHCLSAEMQEAPPLVLVLRQMEDSEKQSHRRWLIFLNYFLNIGIGQTSGDEEQMEWWRFWHNKMSPITPFLSVSPFSNLPAFSSFLKDSLKWDF